MRTLSSAIRCSIVLILVICVGCGGGSSSNPDPRLEMIDLINASRSANGLPLLSHNLELSQVAQAHSDDMVNRNFLDHVNPDDHDFFWRVDNAGILYNGLGENLSAGFKTMKAAHNGFMGSPSHVVNVLKPEANQVGVGYSWGKPANHYGQSMYICVLFMQSP